jgi:nucleoside-triphosphatase
MRTNLLLTGAPGVGKTTIIRKVVEGMRVSAGGFYTEEIRVGGVRTGFRVIDLEGNRGLLAHVDRREIRSGDTARLPRVGKYFIGVSDFEQIGVRALAEALSSREILVADEIGKMELSSARFRSVVREALDSPRMFLAVIQQRADPFLDAIRGRSDVRLIRVTAGNRENLPEEIVDLLGRESQDDPGGVGFDAP